MRISIVTVGTRGDVVPYVALALGLRARGHDVAIATHHDHRELVTRHGVAYRAICDDFGELMRSDLGRAWIESSDSILRYVRTVEELFGTRALRWYEEQARAAEGADVVLAHPFALGAICAAEARVQRLLVLPLVPFVISREATVFFPRSALLRPLNRWLGALSFVLFTRPFLRPLTALRSSLGLAPITNVGEHLVEIGAPILHLYSPYLEPRFPDWPDQAEVTGACFLDETGVRPPPSDLVDFVGAGPAPVYVGFGSMTGHDPEQLAQLAIDAVRRARKRAVLVTGWGGLRGATASDDVFVTGEVPHDWLFPRVAAVVHHGGAGTTAAGLRAGKPTVVTAFFGDQPYWGRIVTRLGIGPEWIPKRKLTAERLARAIRRATSEVAIQVRAEALGAALRAEDGVARTVEAIERVTCGRP